MRKAEIITHLENLSRRESIGEEHFPKFIAEQNKQAREACKLAANLLRKLWSAPIEQMPEDIQKMKALSLKAKITSTKRGKPNEFSE